MQYQPYSVPTKTGMFSVTADINKSTSQKLFQCLHGYNQDLRQMSRRC